MCPPMVPTFENLSGCTGAHVDKDPRGPEFISFDEPCAYFVKFFFIKEINSSEKRGVTASMAHEIEAALQACGPDDEIDPAALLLIHPSDVPVPSADASHAESAELLLPGPPPLQAEESLSGGEMLAPTVVLDEPPPSMPPSPPPSVTSGTVDLTHIPPEHLAMLCSNPSENACACV